MNKLLSLMLIFTFTSASQASTITLNLKNNVYIKGSITSSSMTEAIDELMLLNKNRTDVSQKIYIVLDSPGGSIMAGNRFIRFANTIPNVHTICIFCASMAHAIAQGVSGNRYALPDNIMMAHRAKGGFRGQFEDGEVESQLRLFKLIVRSMEQRNARRIGISLNRYKRQVANEWWTYGSESKSQNVVDYIVDVKCTQPLMDKKITKISTGFFGSASVLVPACPIM